jgi:hypothetical protein
MSNIVPMQPYPGHPLRSLKQFAAKADSIARRYDELEGLENFRETLKATTSRERIDKQFADAKRTAVLDEHHQTLLAWCEAAVKRFDPDDSYETDDDKQYHLKPSVVAARIAALIGAFPGGSPSDPAVYLKVMMEHVCSVEALSLIALDAAIWEAVGTLKFIPSVSELMVSVKRQNAQWRKRLMAIHNIAEAAQWALADIEELAEGVTNNNGTELT